VAPAKIFEKKFGITGISKNWKMPKGISPSKIEKNLQDSYENTAKCQNLQDSYENTAKCQKLIRKYFDMLYKLNEDDVEQLNYNNENLWDVIFGMTSKFNIDDINSYLAGNYAYVMDADRKYMALKCKIFSKLSGKTIRPKKYSKIEDEYIRISEAYREYSFQYVPSMKTLEKIWEQLK
jgi:hypothetical protein